MRVGYISLTEEVMKTISSEVYNTLVARDDKVDIKKKIKLIAF